MNILTDKLPEGVKVNGTFFYLNTDFRAGVEFEEMLEKGSVRDCFLEEVCDVFMYLSDMLLCMGVTPEELTERDALRREYIDSVKASLTGHLNNTVIQYPDGSRKPLKKK